MDKTVLDLLAFYQKELRESQEGQGALKKLGITSPEVVSHFQLGYSSGRAWDVASSEQKRLLKARGLAHHLGEKLKRCVVIPALDANGQLADLCGLWLWGRDRRYVNWHREPRGLIGVQALSVFPEIVLCSPPVRALYVRQHGYQNVIGIRSAEELKRNLHLFENVQRVYLLAKEKRSKILGALKDMDVVSLTVPGNIRNVPAECLASIGKRPVSKQPSKRKTAVPVKLKARTENRLHFEAGQTQYRIESLALSGLGMRVRVRVERNKASFLDKVDLASASARKRFARLCSMQIGIASPEIEQHLTAIADKLDELELEEAQRHTRTPNVLSRSEHGEALGLLRGQDVLSLQADALERHFGFIAEDKNKRLALLVAASRLLDKPLGAVVRGPAGCGKSALIGAVGKVLPLVDVLYFSRMTTQSLYFLPKEHLNHKLLICDEYEGLADSEYALRTVMSNQTLSLAITIREGGKVPVTRTVEIPATLAILVSTTGHINVENLSRFIELSLDTSPEQTAKVMQAQAKVSSHANVDNAAVQKLRNASQLLKPCAVDIPFADSLVYASGNVLARRQFAQVVGLISAHAALYQHQRDTRTEQGRLIVTATKQDYAAVHPLLAAVVDHFEESLSPAAMQLLSEVGRRDEATFTLKDILKWMGWTYSKAYRVSRELARLDLLIPDRCTNGVERRFEAAPYFRTERGISQIAPPKVS